MLVRNVVMALRYNVLHCIVLLCMYESFGCLYAFQFSHAVCFLAGTDKAQT